jgi:hypothetical protein
MLEDKSSTVSPWLFAVRQSCRAMRSQSKANQTRSGCHFGSINAEF